MRPKILTSKNFCNPKFLLSEIFCNTGKYGKTFSFFKLCIFVFKMCIFLFTGFLYIGNSFITNLLVGIGVNYNLFFRSFVFITNRKQ